MKTSTKDQVTGKFHEVKGTFKKMAGEMIDNPKLRAEGAGEKFTGEIQGKVGQIEKVLGK